MFVAGFKSLAAELGPLAGLLHQAAQGSLVPAAVLGVPRLGDDGYVEPVDGWPGTEVVVEFSAGYGSEAGSVPASIRDWMLVQIADAYANPSAVLIGVTASRLDFIDGLLTPYIVPR